MSRPDQVLLVLAVFVMGALSGAANGLPSPPGATLAWASGTVGLIAMSVHLINEYADRDTDPLTRRTRFSGGSGALHELRLPASVARVAATVSAVTAVAAPGAGWWTGLLSPLVVGLFMVGLAGGWAYSVGPRLVRRGWGEVINAALGGLLLPLSGATMLGAELTFGVQFVPFALLVFVNLLETQWADRDADRAVGKLTLASRLEAPSIRALGAVCVGAAFVFSFAVQPPLVAAAGWVALPLAIVAVVRLGLGRPGPAVAAMLLFGAGQTVAWGWLAATG